MATTTMFQLFCNNIHNYTNHCHVPSPTLSPHSRGVGGFEGRGESEEGILCQPTADAHTPCGRSPFDAHRAAYGKQVPDSQICHHISDRLLLVAEINNAYHTTVRSLHSPIEKPE